LIILSFDLFFVLALSSFLRYAKDTHFMSPYLPNEGEEGHDDGAGLYYEGVGVTGLLQDPHPHVNLGLATSFTLL
jgi:hypothetical protein